MFNMRLNPPLLQLFFFTVCLVILHCSLLWINLQLACLQLGKTQHFYRQCQNHELTQEERTFLGFRDFTLGTMAVFFHLLYLSALFYIFPQFQKFFISLQFLHIYMKAPCFKYFYLFQFSPNILSDFKLQNTVDVEAPFFFLFNQYMTLFLMHLRRTWPCHCQTDCSAPWSPGSSVQLLIFLLILQLLCNVY